MKRSYRSNVTQDSVGNTVIYILKGHTSDVYKDIEELDERYPSQAYGTHRVGPVESLDAADDIIRVRIERNVNSD